MKHINLKWLQHWIGLLVVLLSLALLQRDGPLPQDVESRLRATSTHYAFNFTTWEIDALARKVAIGLLAPQRFMGEEERSRFVLDYLTQVREARQITSAINEAFTNPDIADPETTTASQQAALADLRVQMQRTGQVAEAILGEQVSVVLNQGGFGTLSQILPPVSGTFTPLPYLLVISPREVIESTYQRSLVAGLTAADQDAIEARIGAEFPDYSAYVTSIGGLSAYPSMLLESSSIDWIGDVFAHEWTHHYLLTSPLGLYYNRSGETRTINETTASLIGEWAGQEVVLRYYATFLDRPKQLPEPLTRPPASADTPPRFDFNAEMHRTRVNVDSMLAEGKIKEAEWYMEAQRRYFVAQGYRIRRLNQAYFAFHGAYASTPGASGSDPIGPFMRQIWAISPTPWNFVQALKPITSLNELRGAFLEIEAR